MIIVIFRYPPDTKKKNESSSFCKNNIFTMAACALEFIIHVFGEIVLTFLQCHKSYFLQASHSVKGFKGQQHKI